MRFRDIELLTDTYRELWKKRDKKGIRRFIEEIIFDLSDRPLTVKHYIRLMNGICGLNLMTPIEFMAVMSSILAELEEEHNEICGRYGKSVIKSIQ